MTVRIMCTRIGRTARAAAEGTAYTLISVKEQTEICNQLKKLLGKEVPKATVPESFGEVPAYNPIASRTTAKKKFSHNRSFNRKAP